MMAATMASWSELQTAAPTLAAFGRRRLERRIADLATLRADGAPRLHPVSPFFGDGRFVSMEPASPKVADLRRGPHYALHGGYRPAGRHVVFESRLARVLATTYDQGPRRERWAPPTRP